MDRHHGHCEQGYSGWDRTGQSKGSAAGKGEILTEFAIAGSGDEPPKVLPCGDRLNQVSALALDGWFHRQAAVGLHAEHHVGQ